MVKTLCIVQARLTSSRLPNKVLMILGNSGKTVLEHVYERLNQSKLIDKIVFAIPDTKLNNPLEDFLISHDFEYYRGSENDVLDRFYQCAQKYNPEIIVRATCDNPCVDWFMADEMIKMISDNDYVKYYNAPIGTGVEVFTFKSFKTVHQEACSESQHEHVTPFYYQNPNIFKIGTYIFPKQFRRDYRLTMDTELDNLFIQNIYNSIYKGYPFSNDDLYKYLESNPSIADINKDVKQKNI